AGGGRVGGELVEIEAADRPGIARIAGKKRAFDGLREVDEGEDRPVQIGEVGREKSLLLGRELFGWVAHGWAIVRLPWDAQMMVTKPLTVCQFGDVRASSRAPS